MNNVIQLYQTKTIEGEELEYTFENMVMALLNPDYPPKSTKR